MNAETAATISDRIVAGMDVLSEKIHNWRDLLGNAETINMSSSLDCLLVRLAKAMNLTGPEYSSPYEIMLIFLTGMELESSPFDVHHIHYASSAMIEWSINHGFEAPTTGQYSNLDLYTEWMTKF